MSFKDRNERIMEIQKRVRIFAKICGYTEPGYRQRFYLAIMNNGALQNAILKNDVSFYENHLDFLNSLPNSERDDASARFRKTVFSSCLEQAAKIEDKMDDLYYN
ncbi:MAG: hypothetical protein LBC71_04950 [Oscillospiraceae bacterium]|jgi:hypothetical protein|nr:hypothetical protein [Oscillospiraceae bacterium]